MIEIIITENEQNQRLDRFLRKYLPGAPLSHVYKMIRRDVKVNGRRAASEAILQADDALTIYADEALFNDWRKKVMGIPAKRQFAIIYEDENLLIADKPKGLLTHGDETEKKNTLVNQVTGYLIEKGDYIPAKEKTFVPAAANRLDRNTSGLVIFGKNFRTMQALNKMLRERKSIQKLYLAACFGEIRTDLYLQGTIQKDENKNKVSIESDPSSGGKIAQTIIRPIEIKNGYTLVEAELLTGRTHQIRVHLASRGFPIIADPKYGDLKKNKAFAKRFNTSTSNTDTQFLHAYKLKFQDCEEPLSYMNGSVFLSELPKELKNCWEQL